MFFTLLPVFFQQSSPFCLPEREQNSVRPEDIAAIQCKPGR
ncbi:MAG: hypothetical protein ABRQ38_11485 [Candidatus Eremiobacterota bacterium]